MRYNFTECLSILSKEDIDRVYQRILGKKEFNLRQKYINPRTRNAYLLFANSVILKETHYFVYQKINTLINQHHRLNILDLGIGEGLMWKRVLENIHKQPDITLKITGIDYSDTALKQLKINLSRFSYCGVTPIKANLSKLDVKTLPERPDIVLSSLSLHHLRMRDKLKIISKIYHLNPKLFIIIEVDHNLEMIRDARLRNISATLLYKDVFDTVRSMTDTRHREQILNNFYYDEYVSILKSSRLGLGEKYIALSDWSSILCGSGFKINDIKISFTGVNNVYKIGILEMRR